MSDEPCAECVRLGDCQHMSYHEHGDSAFCNGCRSVFDIGAKPLPPKRDGPTVHRFRPGIPAIISRCGIDVEYASMATFSNYTREVNCSDCIADRDRSAPEPSPVPTILGPSKKVEVPDGFYDRTASEPPPGNLVTCVARDEAGGPCGYLEREHPVDHDIWSCPEYDAGPAPEPDDEAEPTPLPLIHCILCNGDIEEYLEFLFATYVHEDDANLTEKAQDLKRALIEVTERSASEPAGVDPRPSTASPSPRSREPERAADRARAASEPPSSRAQDAKPFCITCGVTGHQARPDCEQSASEPTRCPTCNSPKKIWRGCLRDHPGWPDQGEWHAAAYTEHHELGKCEMCPSDWHERTASEPGRPHGPFSCEDVGCDGCVGRSASGPEPRFPTCEECRARAPRWGLIKHAIYCSSFRPTGDKL